MLNIKKHHANGNKFTNFISLVITNDLISFNIETVNQNIKSSVITKSQKNSLRVIINKESPTITIFLIKVIS